MTMNRKKLVDSFKRYEHWSRKETENGTLLIGNPHKDKPYWWLIHIFPKISPEKIKEFSMCLFVPIYFALVGVQLDVINNFSFVRFFIFFVFLYFL